MQRSFWEQLDAANDEAEVRRCIAEGLYAPPLLGIAQEWIRRKEDARTAEAAARIEKREEESLSISRKALRNSERANSIAISAIVLSVITAIAVAIIGYLLERLS